MSEDPERSDGDERTMGSVSEPVLEVDALGMVCPMPVLELARTIAAADLPAGAVVRLLSDDPAAANDVPAWCAMRGHHYLGAAQTPAGTAYVVRLSG